MTRIGLVGHCGPDAYMLRSAVKYAARDADVQMINDQATLEKAIEQGASLLLVNRLLDGSFAQHEGVKLIANLKERGVPARTMLISNYPDAQQAAESAGAAPGFGKSEVGTPKMRDALARALSVDAPGAER